MRRKPGLLATLIASIVSLFFLGGNSLAASTLVQGDSSTLGVLTYTRYLDGKPMLIFSEQTGEKISAINKIDNIVLRDSSWQDLALELAVRSVLDVPRSTIKLERGGIYGLFVERAYLAGGDSQPEIRIDGKKLSSGKSYYGFKYVKVGERRLKAGKHRVEVDGLPKGAEVFLVDARDRSISGKAILRRIGESEVGIAYVLSQDFRIYVPRETNYRLRARMVSDFAASEEEIAEEAAANAPTVEVDNERFSLDGYLGGESLLDSNRFWWESKSVNLAKGSHEIRLLNSDKFKVDLVIFEPETERWNGTAGRQPEIIFKKINPTKYLVEVSRAREPFWLVFSESFHLQWRLYRLPAEDGVEGDGLKDIIADYPRLRVSEARHSQKFTPGDIGYLLRPTDVEDHFLVNTYANGWYIDPKKLGLGKEFTLVLYFWPQSLFYLGLLISGLTLASGLAYLGYDYLRRKK